MRKFISSRQAHGLAVLFIAILLSGCFSKPFLKKPPDGYIGNIKIQSIEVVKTNAVQSDIIVDAVKSRLQIAAADLAGAKAVDMKVTLDYLTVPLPGGAVTSTLLGSDTKLRGVVEILDAGQLVAKFRIAAEYKEGGLLGGTMTISIVDTKNAVADKFAAFTIGYMQ